MTREEAIKVLSNYDVNGVWADVDGKPYNAKEQAEAFDMAIEALQGKSINCNYTCSDCVHQNKAYEEEPCHSCFNNDGVGYEPVKHGKWENHGNMWLTCSLCDWECAFHYDYCPQCGAKMDKGGETK